MIVDALWDNHMREVAESFITLFKNEITFELLGILFSQGGIQFTKHSNTDTLGRHGIKRLLPQVFYFVKNKPSQLQGLLLP